MDSTRFDAFTRRLSAVVSRRAALGFMGGGLVSMMSLASGQGKKRRGKNKKRKKKQSPSPPNSPPPPGLACPAGQRPCRGGCLSTLICCDDADCAGGRTCQDGTCACPADRPLVCPGSTVCAQCCTATDCRPAGHNDGQVCQDGACLCTIDGSRRCPDGVCGLCCDANECGAGATQCIPYTGGIQFCVCDRLYCRGYCPNHECANRCGDACATAGSECCGSGVGRLVCQADVIDGQLRCLPPPE